jgi:hypothetical protein
LPLLQKFNGKNKPVQMNGLGHIRFNLSATFPPPIHGALPANLYAIYTNTMVPKISNIFVTSFRVQIYTFLQNDYMEKKKLNLNFLILSISFNIGMVFLKFITARGTFSSILMPIVAVAPIGPF